MTLFNFRVEKLNLVPGVAINIYWLVDSGAAERNFTAEQKTKSFYF